MCKPPNQIEPAATFTAFLIAVLVGAKRSGRQSPRTDCHAARRSRSSIGSSLLDFTLQAADEGDTTTVVETVAEAGERIAETAAETNSEEAGERVNPEGPREIVTDKGYRQQKSRE
jgi:hypothetical protein